MASLYAKRKKEEEQTRRDERKNKSVAIADTTQKKVPTVDLGSGANSSVTNTVNESKPLPRLRKNTTTAEERQAKRDNFAEKWNNYRNPETEFANTTDEQFVKAAVDSNKKLNKTDEKRAKQIVKDQKSDYGINPNDVFEYGQDYVDNKRKQARESLTPEERKYQDYLQALDNQTSNTYGFVRGMAKAIPGLDRYINKKQDELIANGELNRDDIIRTEKEQGEMTQKQNPLADLSGQTVGNAAMYSFANAALEPIKAFDKAAKGLKLGEKGTEAVANLLRGQTADTLLSTLPKIVDDVKAGEDAKTVAKNALKDEAVNLGFNLVPEVLGQLGNTTKKSSKGIELSDETKEWIKDVEEGNALDGKITLLPNNTDFDPQVEKMPNNNPTEPNEINLANKSAKQTNQANPDEDLYNKMREAAIVDYEEATLARGEQIDPVKEKEYVDRVTERFRENSSPDNLTQDVTEDYRKISDNPTVNADRLVENGNKVSKTADTIKNSNEVFGNEFETRYGGDSNFMYKEKSEETTMRKASEYINAKGKDVAYNELLDSERAYTSEDVDAAMQLVEDLKSQARNMFDSDADELWIQASRLRRRLQLESSNDAQVLQALQKWSRNTPEGALSYAVGDIAQRVDAKKVKGYSAAVTNLADQAEDILRNATSPEDAARKIKGLFELDLQYFASSSTKNNFSGYKEAEGGQMVMNFINQEIKKGKSAKELSEEVGKMIKRANGVSTLSSSDEKAMLKLFEQAEGLDQNSRERKILLSKAANILEDTMPNSLSQGVKSLIYDNMLASVKTMITRNMGGNVGYNAIELATKPFKVGADAVVGMFTGNRTQALSGKALKEGAKGFGQGIGEWADDIKNGVNTTRSGFNDSIENALDSAQKSFHANTNNKIGNGVLKALNAYDQVVRKGMELGDRPVYEATYNATKTELEKVVEKFGEEGLKRGLPENVKATGDELIEFYARNAALESVMQNNSLTKEGLKKIKQAMSDLSRDILGIDIASTPNMPFVEVPGNMLSRYVQYTPLGIVGNTLRSVGEKAKYGAVNQRRLTNELGRNALGGLLTYGGIKLAQNGKVSDPYSEDADERKAQQQNDYIEYAFEPTEGDQYDLSDIAVLGPKLKEGKILADSMEENGDWKGYWKGIIPSLQAGMSDTLFEGINRLTGSDAKYSSSEGFLENMFNSVKSGLGSMTLPTVIRQTAQMTDPYKRDLGDYGTDEYYKNSFKNNIPGLRQTLDPKIDMSGEEVRQDNGREGLEKFWDTYLAPYKHSEYQKNLPEMNKEADRIKAETNGEVNPQLPVLNKKDLTGTKGFDSESYTHEQLYNAQKETYSRNEELGEHIVNSDYYKTLSPEEQGRMLDTMYSASKAVTKENVVRYGLSEQEIAEKEKEDSIYTTDDKYATFIKNGDYDGAIQYYKDRQTASELGYSGVDAYQKAVEVYNGDDNLVKNYADYSNAYKEKTGIPIGNAKTADVVMDLRNTSSYSDEEKGQILYKKINSNMSKEASEAYEKNGAKGLWDLYNGKYDANGTETKSSNKTMQSKSESVPGLSTDMVRQVTAGGMSSTQLDSLDKKYQSYSWTQDGKPSSMSTAKQSTLIPFLKQENVKPTDGGNIIISNKGGVGNLAKGAQGMYNAMGAEGVYTFYDIKTNADIDKSNGLVKDEILAYIMINYPQYDPEMLYQTYFR